MIRRLAGYVAWRREDWLSCQAVRRSLQAFWSSPSAGSVRPHTFGPSFRQTASLPSPMVLWPANGQNR